PTWCSPTAALQLRPSLTGYGFSAGETSRPNGQTCFGVHNFHGERRAPGQTGGESEESRLSPARQRPWAGTLDQVAFARICCCLPTSAQAIGEQRFPAPACFESR